MSWKDSLGDHICDLGLNVRTLNIVEAADVQTIADLTAWTEDELMALPGFGEGCLNNVKERLAMVGKKLQPPKHISPSQSVSNRQCFVCHNSIPEREGVFHAHLRILTHQGTCHDFVHSLERDRSNSKRGRWKPKAKILQEIRNLQECCDIRETFEMRKKQESNASPTA